MFTTNRAGLLVRKNTNSDPNFANVSVLMSFDGANGSTTFTDRGPGTKSFTGFNSAQLSTAQSVSGGSSLLLNGTGAYIQTAASADFEFPGDFTVEWWSRKTADGSGSYDTVATTDTSNASGINGWIIELSATRGLFMGSSGSTLISVALNPNTSTWEHWAVCRSGSTVRGFRAGALVGTGTSSLSVPALGPFGIGRNVNLASYPFNGHIDELRITKGVALYTSTFTPPTPPLPGA